MAFVLRKSARSIGAGLKLKNLLGFADIWNGIFSHVARIKLRMSAHMGPSDIFKQSKLLSETVSCKSYTKTDFCIDDFEN